MLDRRLGIGFARGRESAAAQDMAADRQRDFIIERAGVCLLVLDTEFRQKIENHRRLHFELARQLIDANLTHTGNRS